MKEVEKKDAPEISGGYVGPLVTDDPGPGCITPVFPDYPQNPRLDDPFGQGDLPVGTRG